MAAPTLQNFYDVSSWMYGSPTSNVLPPPPPGLSKFQYAPGRYDSGLLPTGFHGASFKTQGPEPEIIIGYEGTDVGGIEERPAFLLAQIEADVALYFGIIPPALLDAVAFTKKVVAAAREQGISTDRITITGHSLGAGAAAYVAAELGLDGVTFAALGLSTDDIPASGAGTLTNYVEFGDPVANYSRTPVNYEGAFLYSDDIRRVGDATYTGSEFDKLGFKTVLRQDLRDAGAQFEPGKTTDDRIAGLVDFGILAASYHPLTVYGPDLGLDTNNVGAVDASRIVAGKDFALLYGDLADRSGLVSDAYYHLKNPDVRAAGTDAEEHYNSVGFREGRDPNAFFSTIGYRAANADVVPTGANPLDLYHESGWTEGRDPGANFDVEFYLARYPDVRAAGIDPLAHYLDVGRYEGRAIHAAIGRPDDVVQAHGFDAEYYLLANKDVAEAALGTPDPLAFARQHYDFSGWREGRDGNATFDTRGYLKAYPDIAAAGIDPLAHYDAAGWKEGRDPSADFDTEAYLARNPDVAAAGINPLTHYLAYGLYEGRSAAGDGMFG